MRTLFFPQFNFFKGFPPIKRHISVIRDISLEIKHLTEKLSGIYDVALTGDNGALPCIIICEEKFLPSLLKKQLPEDYKLLCPKQSVLLFTSENPIIWIGGKNRKYLEGTVKFLTEVIDILTQGTLTAGDFHIHTRHSDGFATENNAVLFAVRANLDVIAITDHYSIKGAKAVKKSSGEIFPVICGQETSDRSGNHILLYNNNLSLKKLAPYKVAALWEKGVIDIVLAHPSDPAYFQDVKRPIGLEAFNYISGAPLAGIQFAEKMLSRKIALPVLGNSDAHLAEDIGAARTYIYSETASPDSVLKSLFDGKTVARFQDFLAGDPKLLPVIKKLLYSSNLLDGKLLPLTKSAFFNMAGKKSKEIVMETEKKLSAGLLEVSTNKKTLVFVDEEPLIYSSSAQQNGFMLKSGNSAKIKMVTQCNSDTKVKIFPPKSTWKKLKRVKPSSSSIFCDWAECDCADTVFKLPPDARHCLIRTGKIFERILEINGEKEKLLCNSGMIKSLNSRLKNGKNTVSLLNSGMAGFKFFEGIELKNWQMRLPGKNWENIKAASNLQSLGKVPKDFSGNIYYQTKVPALKYLPTLYFSACDGYIEIIFNGKRLLSRGNAHWEDDFFVELPDKGGGPLIVKLENRTAFCGITGPVYAGIETNIKKQPLTVDYKQDETIVLLTLSEPRVRGFLSGKNVKRFEFLAGAKTEPLYLPPEHLFETLILNSFNTGRYFPEYLPLSKVPETLFQI